MVQPRSQALARIPKALSAGVAREVRTIARIKRLEKEHSAVTLVFSARDEERNQAVVLRDFLTERPRKSEPRPKEKKSN